MEEVQPTDLKGKSSRVMRLCMYSASLCMDRQYMSMSKVKRRMLKRECPTTIAARPCTVDFVCEVV